MKSVLLVFSKQDEKQLQNPIREAFENAGALVDTERNLKQLPGRLQARRYDYIVCGLHLAMDASSPVLPDGGVKLCVEARKLSAAPIALVAPGRLNEIRLRIRKIPPPIPEMWENDDNLPQLLVGLFGEVKTRRSRLDILIRAAEQGDWSYVMRGDGIAFDKKGRLNTNPAFLDAQRQLSEALMNAPRATWYKSFSSLGRIIGGELLRNTPQFELELKAGINAVDGIDNTRLTFSVAGEHYQIALEAIHVPDKPEHWIIKAPLVRSIQGEEPPNGNLFEGSPKPLRCLVICADTSGLVEEVTGEGGRPLVLDELPTVKRECMKVRKLLEKQPNVSDVVWLGGDGKPLTKERLLEVLSKGPWDIVHYAGHSKFKYTPGKEERGYLFVGKRNGPQPIEMGEIAPSLRGSRLLYLSGCESGNSTFAIEAARAGIPAVVGFRWRILDTEAEYHAKLFYQSLFEQQAIDTAFWNVRKTIHAKGMEKNNAWASSVLVMH